MSKDKTPSDLDKTRLKMLRDLRAKREEVDRVNDLGGPLEGINSNPDDSGMTDDTDSPYAPPKRRESLMSQMRSAHFVIELPLPERTTFEGKLSQGPYEAVKRKELSLMKQGDLLKQATQIVADKGLDISYLKNIPGDLRKRKKTYIDIILRPVTLTKQLTGQTKKSRKRKRNTRRKSRKSRKSRRRRKSRKSRRRRHK